MKSSQWEQRGHRLKSGPQSAGDRPVLSFDARPLRSHHGGKFGHLANSALLTCRGTSAVPMAKILRAGRSSQPPTETIALSGQAQKGAPGLKGQSQCAHLAYHMAAPG